MADLSALFNSPPGPSRPPPPRTPSPSPSPSPNGSPRRRSSQPLFLSPNGTATPIRSRPGPARAEPNARFNFEPEIDPFEEDNYRPGAYTNGLGTGAEESVITGQLGNYDPLAPVLGAEEDEPGRKKRRVMPKIDAERLMSDHGLPALMRDAKRFKVRGKGHETQDLKSLLSTYQIWAHRMFPRGDFMGTMSRVENVLRTRRMENAMKGYRDVFHPPPPSPERNDQDLDMDRDTHLTPPPMSQEPHNHPSSGNENANANANGSRNISEAGGDEPSFDEADLDEMAAMEEMEREQTSRPRNMQGETGDDEPPVLEEEDEWEGLYD